MAPQRSRQGIARTLLLMPMGAAVLSAALVGSWLVGAREPLVALRLPKPEPEAVATKVGTPQNPGTLIAGEGKPSTLEGSWPQFRGS
ncbi:hypothetical protein HQ576_19760, partial [bacterium]|nr:hypothetical protein [bacterium]